MSLSELLPEVHNLPRHDKESLLQFLANSLASDEVVPTISNGANLAVWSPFGAFEAAPNATNGAGCRGGRIMNGAAAQFPFVETNPTIGAISRMPMLPLTTLDWSEQSFLFGLLDTGATINVLPHSAGVQLGAIWDKQSTAVQLTGNLANVEARVLVVSAQVAAFTPVRLAFAWTKSNSVPGILGQTNFFQEFDVCFFPQPIDLRGATEILGECTT